MLEFIVPFQRLLLKEEIWKEATAFFVLMNSFLEAIFYQQGILFKTKLSTALPWTSLG